MSLLIVLYTYVKGGADAWAEPGLALRLPTGAAEAAQVRGAVMRLARRHGQAGGRRPSVYNSVDPCIEINLLSNS